MKSNLVYFWEHVSHTKDPGLEPMLPKERSRPIDVSNSWTRPSQMWLAVFSMHSQQNTRRIHKWLKKSVCLSLYSYCHNSLIIISRLKMLSKCFRTNRHPPEFVQPLLQTSKHSPHIRTWMWYVSFDIWTMCLLTGHQGDLNMQLIHWQINSQLATILSYVNTLLVDYPTIASPLASSVTMHPPAIDTPLESSSSGSHLHTASICPSPSSEHPSLKLDTTPQASPRHSDHPTPPVLSLLSTSSQCSLTLGNSEVILFTEADVPDPVAVLFATNIPCLNKMWDDKPIHWDGISILSIRGHPVTLVYWPEI